MTIQKMQDRKQEPGYTNEKIAGLSENPQTFREEAVVYGAENRRGPYTLKDYYALPDERRAELIDGYIYDMAAPDVIHQTILGELILQFAPCVEKHPECILLFAPFDVRLDNDDYTIVQPDLMIICGNGLTVKRMNGAPDFVIEILSPSNRAHDMIRKLEKYADAGVREYWIVDPKNLVVIVYDLEHTDIPSIHPFRNRIPVLISDRECEIDFDKIILKIEKFL